MISSVARCADLFWCRNSMPRTGMRFRYGYHRGFCLGFEDGPADGNRVAILHRELACSWSGWRTTENHRRLVDDDPAKGALTCWLTIHRHHAARVMCARMFSRHGPCSGLLTPWTSCELPPYSRQAVEVATEPATHVHGGRHAIGGDDARRRDHFGAAAAFCACSVPSSCLPSEPACRPSAARRPGRPRECAVDAAIPPFRLCEEVAPVTLLVAVLPVASVVALLLPPIAR